MVGGEASTLAPHFFMSTRGEMSNRTETYDKAEMLME